MSIRSCCYARNPLRLGEIDSGKSFEAQPIRLLHRNKLFAEPPADRQSALFMSVMVRDIRLFIYICPFLRAKV